MDARHAEALAAFRTFNYETIYLRGASRQQASAVVGMLRALVEYFAAHPELIPDVAERRRGDRRVRRRRMRLSGRLRRGHDRPIRVSQRRHAARLADRPTAERHRPLDSSRCHRLRHRRTDPRAIHSRRSSVMRTAECSCVRIQNLLLTTASSTSAATSAASMPAFTSAANDLVRLLASGVLGETRELLGHVAIGFIDTRAHEARAEHRDVDVLAGRGQFVKEGFGDAHDGELARGVGTHARARRRARLRRPC